MVNVQSFLTNNEAGQIVIKSLESLEDNQEKPHSHQSVHPEECELFWHLAEGSLAILKRADIVKLFRLNGCRLKAIILLSFFFWGWAYHIGFQLAGCIFNVLHEVEILFPHCTLYCLLGGLFDLFFGLMSSLDHYILRCLGGVSNIVDHILYIFLCCLFGIILEMHSRILHILEQVIILHSHSSFNILSHILFRLLLGFMSMVSECIFRLSQIIKFLVFILDGICLCGILRWVVVNLDRVSLWQSICWIINGEIWRGMSWVKGDNMTIRSVVYCMSRLVLCCDSCADRRIVVIGRSGPKVLNMLWRVPGIVLAVPSKQVGAFLQLAVDPGKIGSAHI